MSIVNEIQNALFAKQDLKYQKFHSGLVPTIDSKSIIGVRTPDLRAIAKQFANHPKVETFLKSLPHKYYDENQLHAFILSGIKDYDECVAQVNRFLPFVDNWATCDQLRPKVFAQRANRGRFLKDIECWLDGGSESAMRENDFVVSETSEIYMVRFGIEMLMTYFLDESFNPKFLKRVAKIRSEEYYLNMMVAWYFATALAKQWNATIPYIEKKLLDDWTHNKTIQKAIESYRITDEQKEYLRTLKCK